jgi:Glyoxalase-like domain
MFQLDHVTVAANSLAAGVSHTERALDVEIPTGGSHQIMGTHNHLLRLGEMLFLEVIASDPVAGPLLRPRWFALDDPRIRTQLETSPRLCTWVVRTEDIAAALRSTPKEAGEVVKVGRGKLEWLISVPPDGSMPFDGAFPTILQWPAGPHPASQMPDLGCSLVRLEIEHPDAALISQLLKPFFDDQRVQFSAGPAVSMRATIKTPKGERQLS